MKWVWMAFLLICSFVPLLVLGWLISLPGTLGLYIWVGDYDLLFILLVALGVITLLLTGATFFAMQKDSSGLKTLQVFTSGFAVVGLLYGLGLLAYVLVNSLPLLANTPPLLLIADGSGANGVPNLALTFRSEKPTQHTLNYGVEALDQSISENKPTQEHVMMLRDLLPATRYQWQLNDGDLHSFFTPAIKQEGEKPLLKLGVSGDAHIGVDLDPNDPYRRAGDENVPRSILAYAAKPKNEYNAFYILGDLVHLGMNNNHWRKALDIISTPSLDLPLRPLFGNHDALINGVPRFEAYVYPSALEKQKGSSLYYRNDIGKVHIITLSVPWSSAESFDEKQKQWLIKQLDSIPRDEWRIVMLHSMIYSSGDVEYGLPWYDPPDMVNNLAPILEKYKVNLVLSGHNHFMDYLEKKGVTYVVIGTFGGSLSPIDHISSFSKWRQNRTHGFVDVLVYENKIDLVFRDANTEVLKVFLIEKKK